MKRDWADGYVSDVTYSHGYYHELAPSFIRFFLLVNGHAMPGDGGAYSYCELGYGQGLSANIHAAANPRGEFWGTDFNPDHAVAASNLARQAGSGAQMLALSFEQLMDAQTPQFDFIVLHGVWSWISASAQHAVVEFIRRKLKVGGAVYLSYNILPGWTTERPLRDLLWLHTEHAGAPDAPTTARISGALQFAAELRRQGASYFTECPRASQLLDDMLREDSHQLAHEYFNRSWWLTYFAEVERALEPAGLSFATSLHMSDLSGEVQQRTAGSKVLGPQLGSSLRETANDFVLNRRFRRDLFVRGSLRMARAERDACLHEVAFMALRPASAVSSFVTTPYGKVVLDGKICQPLMAALDALDRPVTLAHLRRVPELSGIAWDALLETLCTLVARRDVCPVFADDASSARPARVQALNSAIASRARHDNTLRYLASPVSGAGVEASRFERLFWLAWQQGGRTAQELCDAGWEHYVALGSPMRTEEGVLSDPVQARTEFGRRAECFAAETVPRWRKLGVIADVRQTAAPAQVRAKARR